MAWTERYVRADAAGGGDGTTDTNSGANGAWTLDEAIAAASAGQRINIKAGTYTFGASKTLAASGAATTAILWQGFTSTAGDLWDTWDSTAFPYFDATGGSYSLIISGSNNWLANIRIRAAHTNTGAAAIDVGGARTRVMQCYVEATANDVDAVAMEFSGNGDGCIVMQSKLVSHATGAQVITLGNTAPGTAVVGNLISGGVLGINAAGSSHIRGNIITGASSHGISASTGNFTIAITNNTIYSVGGNGVNIAESTQTGLTLVYGNAFSTCGAYGIQFPGSVSSGPVCFANLFHACTSGSTNNLYQDYTFDDETDATSPFVSAGTDYGLLLSTEGFQASLPSRWMDLSGTVGKPSMGAVVPYIPTLAEIQQAVWVDYPERTLTG